MPSSAPTFDSELELYFRQVHHDSVVDIGPDEGKYGRMLRRAQPKSRLISVEIDPGYVKQYKLRDIYDEVLVQDAAEPMNDLDRAFDAVILGDCIEHLRKSVGLDLLYLPLQNHYR
jgi:phospholipid N-methyltransferase